MPTVLDLRLHEKAAHTDRWTEIIFRALSSKVAKRWRFVSFRGLSGGEWRGIVDLLAVRKNTSTPTRRSLKAGDLFEIILIQMKGGTARRPTLTERKRLRAVGRTYDATAVVLFEWDRGNTSKFAVLNSTLKWEQQSCAEIFGQ